MNTENNYVETDLGNVSPNPRGEYDPNQEYEYLDLVHMSGGSYICVISLFEKTSESPVPGKTTEIWQCIALPGSLTPEYIAMHDVVEYMADQTKKNAQAAEDAEYNVSGMEANIEELQKQTELDAQTARTARDEAAGYAGAADASRKAAEEHEKDVSALVNGFDANVSQKTTEANTSIENTRQTAVEAVKTQETTSVNTVKTETDKYLEQKKTEYKNSVDADIKRVSDAADSGVSDITKTGNDQIEAVNAAGNVQILKVENEGSEQVNAVQAEGTKQVSDIQNEGSTQVSNIQSEGNTQVANVKTASSEVIHMKTDLMTWSQWFDSFRTGWRGGVEFHRFSVSESPLGTKTGDNADLVAETSTDTVAGRNDYANQMVTHLMFNGIVVNGYVDEEGEPHITAMEGSPEFDPYGGNGDVYVAFMTPFMNRIYTDEKEGWDLSDRYHEGMKPFCKAVRPDGSWRSFYFVAKYPGVYGPDGLVGSISGGKPIRNVSHNNQITTTRAKGSQYCGMTSDDVAWAQWMMDMKFATTNSGSVMSGNTGDYQLQYAATVVETGVKRIIISKENADKLIVGSGVSVGYGGLSKEELYLDRGTQNLHKYADNVKILSIEPYDDDNSAVYVDAPEAFDTSPVALNDTVTSDVYITTLHWFSGSCDNVLGPDGSPSSPTGGKEPFILSNVEFGHGGYTIIADIILNGVYDAETDTYTQTPFIVDDSRNIATSITENYTEIGYSLPDTNSSWKYISDLGYDERYPHLQLPIKVDASSSTGYADGVHTGSRSTETREWLWFGNSGGRSPSGLRCVLAGSALSNAGWLCLLRLSSLRRGVAA